MKICPNCQAQLDDNAAFCLNCGAQQPAQQQQQATYQQEPQQQTVYQQAPQPQYQTTPTDNKKVFSILAYIGILWLVGLLVNPEKNDPRVRFNVGQGIMVSIYSVAVNILVTIITSILTAIFKVKHYTYYGISYTTVHPIATIISSILWLFAAGSAIALMVYGIVNVVQNRDKQLPIIGQFAFYK